VYLQSEEPIPTTKHAWGEVRAFGGGYVVAPPSLHPRGVRYEWALPPQYAFLAPVSKVLPSLISAPTIADNTDEEARPTQAVYRLGCAPSSEEIDLLAFDRDEEFVRAVAKRVGIPHLGATFRCVLPGHEERHPSANLWCDERGIWIYRDHHRRDGRSAFALVEVYAARMAGRVVQPHPPSLARWKVRLLADLGAVRLDPVELPRLPASSTLSAQRLRNGFALLLAVRWWREPGTPAPYTASFAGPWCGMPDGTVNWAKGDLIREGIIVKVGETNDGSRTTSLYLPGKGRQRGDKRGE
jgi:hypothetical protein